MRAGFAERDITPEKGMERPGGYGKSFHTGEVHDPCKVRAVVFDDGEHRAALVGVDTLMVPGSLVKAARERLYTECGLDPQAVLVGASHSHSAGPLGMVQPGAFDDAPEWLRDLAYEKSSCADPRYLRIVEDQIVAAVTEADAGRVPVKCGVDSGIEDRAAFNRRFRMKNGLTYTHPGKGNPDILEPAGPVDPEVGVIGVWDHEDRFLGCVVNYACHGTTGPGSTSADWIYYLEQTVRGALGPEAVVVFLNGACGDVTQVDNLSPYSREFGERSARYVGGRVGAEAVKVLVGMEKGDLHPVRFASRVISIPRRRPTAERLEQDLALVQQEPAGSEASEWTAGVDVTAWTFAKEMVMADYLIAREPVASVELQAVQVGPTVFLANPAELFCQYGLELKARCAFPYTFPVELANDCVGYVPTEEAFGEHGGGYETRITAYSNLEVNAGPKLVNGLLELVADWEPGPEPAPPLAPPFKEPWSYGSVPPEVGVPAIETDP